MSISPPHESATSRSRCGLLVLTLACALCPPLPSAAQDGDEPAFVDEPVIDRQVAVLSLKGSRTESIRALVDTSLQDVAIVVPLSDVEYSASRLGVSLDKNSSLKELSKELLIDIFVRGSVTGKREKTISLTFFDKNGEELSQRSFTGSLRRRDQAKFRKFVEDAYREASSSMRELEEGPPPEEPPEEAVPIGYVDDEIEEDESRELKPLLNMQASIGARNRDALVRLRSMDSDVGGPQTRVYDSLFFTELGIRLHARPYGNKLRDVQGVFVDAELAFAPFFTSVDDFGGVFDSSTFRLSADVGYRLKLDSLEVGPAIGLGVDSFSIDERGRDPDGSEAENLVFPSSTYWYLRAGVVGELPLIDKTLVAQLHAGFRYALGMGDLTPIFGESGSTLGFDVGAYAGGALDMGFTYGAWLRYVTYSLSFSGNASNLAENASSGHDRALYFGVALGYELYDD